MTTMIALRPALTDVLCTGTLRDGRPCLKVLFKAGPGEFNKPFEMKCPKCGKLEWFGPVEILAESSQRRIQ